jgi:hypothetical protein
VALEITDADIAGARVRQTFQTILKDGRQRRYRANEHLTREEVLAMNNRRALYSAGYIEPYPQQHVAAPAATDRFIVQVAPGKFNVIAGTRLNDEPLSKQAAQKLAHSE